MTQRIFTTGCTAKDINDLRPLLDALDAVLIDIRFAPYSQVLHWRQIYLKVLLGSKYLHIPNLGNRTDKEDIITIQNLGLGLETVFSLNKNALLMCACETAENCHRRVIIAELKKRSIETEEISNWKSAASNSVFSS
ncbi:MAG: DUF488 domain-containing protein [Acidobacteriota bacterium]|nr:DUF488 domain-containing protein [Acidobacteriota bacterium]